MRKRIFRTARGQISNRGDLPRFVGLFPCTKADGGVLVYSSISELRVAEFLAWSPEVEKISFEPRLIEFAAHGTLPGVKCWPDFEVVLDGGEVEWVEAKYSADSLSQKEKDTLALLAAHFAREQRRYRVLYRRQLEESGFLATISLLRRYGDLSFAEAAIARALKRLSASPPLLLEQWIALAQSVQVATELLYHLLYHQRLPMLFRPMIHPELQRCRS